MVDPLLHCHRNRHHLAVALRQLMERLLEARARRVAPRRSAEAPVGGYRVRVSGVAGGVQRNGCDGKYMCISEMEN